MPFLLKPYAMLKICLSALIISILIYSQSPSYEGINTYYLRYDVKSSKNQIIDDNLVMVAAKNEFRAENFSFIPISGEISADSDGSNPSIENRIQAQAFKTILIKSGLKSINSKDLDTVISYEGVIITPIKIIKKTFNEIENTYRFEASIEFSPIAFPDKWESLHGKNKLKQLFSDFFQLFKL